MAQQARRAPGRPKKTGNIGAGSTSSKRTVAKSHPLYATKTPIERKEFEVIDGGGIVYMFPQQGETVYDKETDSVRELDTAPTRTLFGVTSRGTRP